MTFDADDPTFRLFPSTAGLAEILQKVMHDSAVERMHPDECYLTTLLSRQTQCRRKDHPTPTSDCTTLGWVRHVTDEIPR